MEENSPCPMVCPDLLPEWTASIRWLPFSIPIGWHRPFRPGNCPKAVINGLRWCTSVPDQEFLLVKWTGAFLTQTLQCCLIQRSFHKIEILIHLIEVIWAGNAVKAITPNILIRRNKGFSIKVKGIRHFTSFNRFHVVHRRHYPSINPSKDCVTSFLVNRNISSLH